MDGRSMVVGRNCHSNQHACSQAEPVREHTNLRGGLHDRRNNHEEILA